MREVILSLVAVGIVSLSCGTTSGGGGSVDKTRSKRPETTIDGLVRVDTDAPGALYLRKDHGIGGYDAIVVAPSFVNYRRKSSRLDPDLEDVYLVSLEQAVIDVADEAHVPIVNNVGDCVIIVGIGLINVELARSNSAKVLGDMTMVIEYRDSMSKQSLLRYMKKERILREDKGISREDQIRKSFDRMIEDVDIISALRAATVVPSSPRPGCQGTLLKAGMPVAE